MGSPAQPAPADKAGWRRRARELPPASADPGPLLDALGRFLASCAGGWIVTYRPLAHEIDLRSLEDRADLGPFALTRTPTGATEPQLTVHPADGPLERHRWGFEQPVDGAPLVPLEEVATVLVPGLLFDRRGARLGHGRGYYDRLLARLPTRALRIGVVAAARVVDHLPTEPHDVAMTHLATEHGVVPCPWPAVGGGETVSDPGSGGCAARPSP